MAAVQEMEDLPVVSALYRISRLAREVTDPRVALDRILDEVMGLLPADSGSIDLINPDTGLLEIEVRRGLPESSHGVRLRPGQGITGWVALHGRALLVEDVRRDPRYVPLRASIRSELAVPMVDHGLTVGVINVDSNLVGAFTRRHLEVLAAITNEATGVVSRLWINQRLQQKSQQLEGLINVGQQLVAQHELGRILMGLTDEARRIMDCRVCTLYLQEQKGGALHLKALSGVGLESGVEEQIRPEDTVIGTAIAHVRQVEVPDLRRTEEHHLSASPLRSELVSFLVTPLVYEQSVIGVLNAYTDAPHRFSNEERRILATLAGLGAVAIQNARLYARVFAGEEVIRRNEKLTTLGLLTAEIAHEIRNPLTVLKLLFESLDLEFPEEDMRRRDVAIIGEKLDQLEGIVSRVLSFGKSREGLHSRWDLCQLLRDTLHLMRLKLAQGGVSIEFAGPPDGMVVEGSKGQLQQAFLNLIINALQAMPEGGSIAIEVTPEPVGGVDSAVVRIADTGHGIDPAIHDRVFDSFLSGHAGGTGLGLGIVKRIVESHHGSVAVEASHPGGTVMRITLPRVRV